MDKKDIYKIEGRIIKKEINQKGGPKCFFYVDVSQFKFVCWSETFMNKFDVDDEVFIEYYMVANEYNGKKYTNYTIKNMTFLNEKQLGFTDTEKEELEKLGVNTNTLSSPNTVLKSENGKIKLAGLTYKIKDIELELVSNS